MKNSIFKTVIPAVAILLAIGGSFATQASEKNTNAIVPGYAPAPTPCNVRTNCRNTGTVLCTVTLGSSVVQFYGKVATSDTVCPVVVYMP